MKARQWTLLGALGLTLAATWWAAQVEEDGAVEGDVAGVVEPATRAQRAPAAAQRPRAQAVAAPTGELAIIREPWPADAATLLQPPLAAQAQSRTAPVVAAPMAPPLPFTFIGSIERGGRRVVMLMEGEQLHLAGVRERIGEHYRVERVTPTQIEFTYLPMQQRQVLETGQD
ncbi:MAG: hypothetical protein AB7S63_14865 [Thauera sp.]